MARSRLAMLSSQNQDNAINMAISESSIAFLELA
jgi:hypothetical protein